MRHVVATGGFVLALAGCKPIESATNPSTPPRIVIVDAGSSGTRIHVYDTSQAALVDLTPMCDGGPPLAQTGPKAVLELWKSCAVEQLVDASTPIRVYATAGMRSLAETDPDRAAQIHAELEAKLRERGHVDVESRTILGVEEARWAWVATNLMLGTLFFGHSPDLGGAGSGDASVGILELGGSSTQVAFVPDDPAVATETLTLDGRSWPLFAVSYLHCGANDARRDLGRESCFFSQCESNPECAACLVGTPATRGAGEFGVCASTIEDGLRDLNARCLVSSEPRPPMTDEPFVLVGNFALLVHNLGAVEADGEVDLGRLWAAAERTCATAWPDLDDMLGAIAPSRRSKVCFDAGLTRALLELYGLSRSTQLVVLEHNPEWALGAAYLERRGSKNSL
jgi:hypothetical protein